ncbi:MAG TPA: pseudouridine synthase [Flavobacterium sp.]|jgi:23S rRNA pseudouridine2457 synthase
MQHHHFILHKPFGYLSQFIYAKKRKKKLLGELYPFPEGTMAIGRLDEDSEGLLLLTTDGMMSEIIRGRRIEKEYYVLVDGIIGEEAVEKLRAGVEIGVKGERYKTVPCKAFIPQAPPEIASRKVRDERHGPVSWVSVTVTEGKYRQVRKMVAAVGFPALRLVRTRIGNIHLQDLPSGEVIPVDLMAAFTD